MYAVHDAPKPTPWSSRGDLGVALSCSYRVFPGVRDLNPPPEPWDIQLHSSIPGSKAQSVDKHTTKDESISRGRTAHMELSPPPLFGRGDEDGFPALTVKSPTSLATSRPVRSRTYSPAALRHLQFEHSALARQQPRRHPVTADAAAPSASMADTLSLNGGSPPQNHHHTHAHHGGKSDRALQHLVEEDISMIMRQRVVQGYGLTSVCLFPASGVCTDVTHDQSFHNAMVARETFAEPALIELWRWLHRAFSSQICCIALTPSR